MDETGTRRATRERHEALLALLRAGVDSVETLADQAGVSPSTVRRDLARLERDGSIARTYGGALVRDEVFHERPFGESAQLNAEAKAAIAARAAELVPAEGTVFLDAGTTCLALARLLVTAGPLTVVTRGLESALLLSRAAGVRVIVVGGQVQPLSHGVVGPLASVALDRLAFDVAFLGADTVDPERGLGEPTVEETHVKEVAARQARRVVLLADSSKLEAANAPAWTRVEPGWTLLTDAAAPAAVVAAFEGRGVTVVAAGG
ncbi:DeoR/GlpR family DNA-binding transcription regulator [Geodermatophilus sp. DSM 45219]|uniref:DeoR/GlpR family DNA-binding transcription regulator n=1 Tax=Geodermatophilus sp. DSM 45219 TaxID=1881103 RepID=UPI0008839CF6|nr:DeoR/GlpR family DNA-binding transcription regulator [Geodermatophilus sp. DSM 45219]SDO14113.1 transcriptional regulator, DeoR family [Geodermatophilus sp. DSM 45219]